MARQLSEEQVQQARELVAAGETYQDVADKLGVSRTSIYRVARDVCRRQKGRPRTAPAMLSDYSRRKIERLREALTRLPGRREVLDELQMSEPEYERLRYLCRRHGLPPLRSGAVGRLPLRREVLRKIKEREQNGEARHEILASLTDRQRAVIDE